MLRVVTLAEADKTIAGLRDAVLIRLMSDCLLRISEAVAVNVGDLHKSTLRITSSKTDQEGRGEVLYIGGPTLKLIDRYRTKAEIQSGALFRHIRRGDHVQSGRLTTVSARVSKDSSVVIRSGSAALSRLHRRVLRLLICRMQAGGSRHRCRRIMPKWNSLNGARSQGSSMGRGSNDGQK